MSCAINAVRFMSHPRNGMQAVSILRAENGIGRNPEAARWQPENQNDCNGSGVAEALRTASATPPTAEGTMQCTELTLGANKRRGSTRDSYRNHVATSRYSELRSASGARWRADTR